ncbi:MAG: cytochrome d ubiquinol oxidase subunit II [Planctomycetota bacterium]|nr:cytochrome d ubiquinol oxidase subunit II [Planctomycetota bacterium]
MTHETLATIWYALVLVLLIGYAILDGFDLGVGILHLFLRGDRRRRIALNAIGPVWDGNEVWLLTGGGALFAAFPPVYATVFSGCYLALMLLLAALIARAVAIEFRSKVESPAWRNAWDWVFSLGSAIAALLLAVAFGNVVRGMPIDSGGNFTGSFFGLLNPFAVLVGLLGVTACAMHGAIYLALKGDDEMRPGLVRAAGGLWMAFALLAAATILAARVAAPFLFQGLLYSLPGEALLIVAVLAILAVSVFLRRGKLGAAFTASATAIGSLIALAGLSTFPRLVPSLTDLSYSLTISNSASTSRTLQAMLIIALIGVPIVLVYTILVHRLFRGKVVLDEEHGY